MASDSAARETTLLPESVELPPSDEDEHQPTAAASAVSDAAMFSPVATHDGYLQVSYLKAKEKASYVSSVLKLLRLVLTGQTW